jgi:hypothetical protein
MMARPKGSKSKDTLGTGSPTVQANSRGRGRPRKSNLPVTDSPPAEEHHDGELIVCIWLHHSNGRLVPMDLAEAFVSSVLESLNEDGDHSTAGESMAAALPTFDLSNVEQIDLSDHRPDDPMPDEAQAGQSSQASSSDAPFVNIISVRTFSDMVATSIRSTPVDSAYASSPSEEELVSHSDVDGLSDETLTEAKHTDLSV